MNSLVFAAFAAVVAASLWMEAMKPDPMTGRRQRDFIVVVLAAMFAMMASGFALIHGLVKVLQ